MNARADVAVVLVADMAASTALRQDVGEARFSRILDEFNTAVGRIVTKHGGRIVKQVGDGFIAAFDAASTALEASIRIQQVTSTANRRRGPSEQIHLRIGVSAGEVAWEGDDLGGIVPVEARRLEALAQEDTILCSDLTRTLARGAGGLSFTDAGELPLRGIREPVRGWTVDWEPVVTSERLGLPEPLQAEPRLKFVGRSGQLEQLESAWRTACRGRGRVVAITGEPGVGKTRLCTEFARRALAEGGIIVYGRCDRMVAYPYQPFVEALTRYTGHAPQIELIPAEHAAELTRIVPQIRVELPGLSDPLVADGETQRFRLFEAMVEWLRFVAREGPVVLVLDDMTWATEPTLALLHHMSARLPEMSALCLVTYRPQEASGALLDVLADVGRGVPFESVHLDGLEQSDVLAALRILLGGDELDSRVAELGSAVWRESGGNPFYVGELFASLLDDGSLRPGDRGWTAVARPGRVSIPSVVGDVVLQRKRTLSGPSQVLLGAAAVAGVAFDPRVIESVVGLGRTEFSAALEEAETAGLVRNSAADLYEFSHALVRDVLYGEHGVARRADLHEGIARAIEARAADHPEDRADDLAVHYSLGPSEDAAARGVWYCCVAAGRASDRFAYAESVIHLQRALDTLPQARLADGDRVRGQLIVELGVAQHRAGAPDGIATLLEGSRLAAEAGDGDLSARAVLAASRGLWTSTGVVDEARVGALRAALELSGATDSAIRSRLLANLSVELGFTGDHSEQDRLSDEATAMAHRLGHPGALVPVLAMRMVTLWRVNRVEERLALALELEELCAAYNRPQASLLAATMGCQAAMEAGDFETADRRLAIIEGVAADLRQPLAMGYARLRQSLRASVSSQFEDSERWAEEAFEFAQASGQPDAKAFWVGQRFNLRFHQGRLPEIYDELAEAADDYPGIVAFRAALGMVAAEIDRFDEARRALEAIYGPDGSGVPDDLNWLISTSFAAQAAARLGDAERCEQLHDQLVPYRHLYVDNASTFWGSVERYIALTLSCMGRHEDAISAFERAAAAHELLPAPALLARTQLEWGEAAVRAGRPSGQIAAKQLEAALSVAEQLDLRAIAARARGWLSTLAN